MRTKPPPGWRGSGACPLLTAKARGEQTAWCDRAGLPVLFSGGGAAQLAAAVQVEQAGLLLADPDSAEAALVLAFLSDGAAPALPGLETENQLTLAYPQEAGVLYESTVTLCGTARAGAEPVTVNGRAALQVGRVWAIAMELAEGENVFTVRQGDEALTLHCTQRTPNSPRSSRSRTARRPPSAANGCAPPPPSPACWRTRRTPLPLRRGCPPGCVLRWARAAA